MKPLNKFYISIVVLLILVGGFLIYFIFNQLSDNLSDNNQNFGETNNLVARKLDGVLVELGQENLLPVAIIIENHFDSRPPVGLSQAKIVYEVLTEAAITRFLAIYDLTEELEEIGPIRSARPYFNELTKEYGALYVHSGGSPVSLRALKIEDGLTDLNEFFGHNAGYFWRSRQRYSPHNLYTSSDLLSQAKEDYSLSKYGDFKSWQFGDDKKEPVNTGNIKELKINYSITPTHQVVWQYNEENNNYERWQINNPHQDEDGSQILADNIIIQIAKHQVVDRIGRKDIDLIGQGKVLVFLDGEIIEGQWQRLEKDNRTFFYNQNGDEIELNSGKIWIQIVPTEQIIEYN